jgi:DNA-binding helix-turn-helix protein
MGIGDRIKERRIQIDMTQDELAERLHYSSKSSISRIELNKQNLTQDKIVEIADVLRTTPSYLMGWTDSPERNSSAKNPINAQLDQTSNDELSDEFRAALNAITRLSPKELQMLITTVQSILLLQSVVPQPAVDSFIGGQPKTPLE